MSSLCLMPEARGGPLPFTLTGTICRLEVGWKLDDSARALRFAKRREGEGRGGVVRRVQGRGPSWKRVAREVEDTRRGFQVLAAERSGLSKALNSSQVSRGKTMWPESVNLAAALRRKLPLNRGARAHLRVSYARHAFLYLAATIPRCTTYTYPRS